MKTGLIKTALAAAIALCSISCRHRMTVMTYNVGVFEKSGNNSLMQVAETIKAAGAGLVSLNELDSCNLRHRTYQLEELRQATGYTGSCFAQAFPFADGAYGNGIISQKPIIRSHRIALPMSDGEEPRCVAVAETDECVFASVHLDHMGESARAEQAEYINNWFKENYSGYNKPVILCGDMNETPDGQAIHILQKEWKLLSGTAPTYPSDAPEVCIDYIFALKSAKKAQSAKTVKAQEHFHHTARTASDHLPVYAVIKY